MIVTLLLHELAQLNIKINLQDDALRISAPKGALTYDLREKLLKHKVDILAWLRKIDVPEEVQSEIPELVLDPVNHYKPFPLSDLQVGFYMANDPYMEFQVRPHYYLEQDRPDLDIERYERAWNKAIQRHKGEIVLINNEGQLQRLEEIPPIKCKIRNFQHLPTDKAVAELMKVRELQMRQELPLDRWPWFELQISLWHEDGIEKKRIHYNNNNFYSDGFGTSRLLSEIERYYEEPDLTLPALELTYRDAVVTLEKLAQTDIGKKARKYWLDRLSDLPPPPELPLKPGMERRCRSRLKRRENILPVEIWQGFKNNAIHYGLTPSNAIFAVYAEVISTWSGSQHFILSNMMTRRLRVHPEIIDILGNFASLYPLEIDMRGNVSFKEQAHRIQEQVLRDANHLHWGGMQVMQALNRLKGEMGTVPCPYVIGSGIFMEGYKKPNFSCLETSQTLLDHQFWEMEDGSYYYVWDLLEEYFPEGMISSMWQFLEKLIISLAGDKTEWERVTFDLLPNQELQQRNLANQTVAPVPDGVLPDLLSSAVAANGEKSALVSVNGSLSYQALSQKSRTLADLLNVKNLGHNAPIAILVDRGEHLLVAVMAVLNSGSAYVPIDPTLPEERISYLVQNSNAKLILTQAKYENRLRLSDNIQQLCVDELSEKLTSTIQKPKGKPTDLAYMIYTSGSTGNPKGVMIDHRGVLNTVVDINKRFNINNSDKLFGVSSFSFDLSVYDIFGTLEAGATLVYPEPDAAFNPAHWLDLLDEQDVTIWNSAPPLMSLMVETAQRQNITLPALRLVLLSGDWIPLALPSAIRKIAPNAKIFSLGGATEASIWSIYYPIDEVKPDWISIPYGYPLANQRWHIRDYANRPTPTWTAGEMYIAGDGLALGYWNDPEKTQKSFIIDELTGERLYRTGDRGRYLPDGCIEFMGRTDSQVKIQGYRIELGEVEATLVQHPAVKEAVVTAQDAKKKNTKQLVAYVLTHGDTTSQELQDFLKGKLPVYMVPTAWFMLDKFPVTHNGKLDRKALPSIDVNLDQTGDTTHNFVAPRNETEEKLAKIWSHVLDKEKIGVFDDFFDNLGGQSFDAVQSLALVKERFGKLLSLGDIWQGKCIANIAQRLSDPSDKKTSSTLIAIDTSCVDRPYFFVHPAGGHVICYAELSKRLNRPVYGFQAKGVDGNGLPMGDISQMASTYITEMQKVQKNGPYTIGGWSSGGVIAFDMVAKLEKENESVDRTIIIDCPSPLEQDTVNETQLLHWFAEDLALDLPLEKLVGLDVTGLTETEQLMAIIDLLDVDQGPWLDTNQLLPIFKVFKSIVGAVRNYHPANINADITLIRAREGVVSEFSKHPYGQRDDWGWGLVTAGEVQTEWCLGVHHTLLTVDNVGAVADLVNGASRIKNRDHTHYP